MLNSFNWVDGVIIATLLLFTISAFGRIFVIETLDLLSFVLAFFLSLIFYSFPASLLQSQFKLALGLSQVVSFMLIWFLIEILFYFVMQTFFKQLSKIRFKYDTVFSIIPSFLRSLIFVAFILILTTAFPIQPAIKREVLNSEIAGLILEKAYALEEPVKAVFGQFSTESLSFVTVEPGANKKIDLGFKTGEISPDNNSEQKMFDLVNEERVKEGVGELEYNEELSIIGRNYSKDMFERGYFSHFSPEGKTVADRGLAARVNFTVIGENLAFAPNVEAAHKGLMNSPGHRANILSKDYKKIGIGVMDGGVYGKMFTQVFSD